MKLFHKSTKSTWLSISIAFSIVYCCFSKPDSPHNETRLRSTTIAHSAITFQRKICISYGDYKNSPFKSNEIKKNALPLQLKNSCVWKQSLNI